LTTWGLPLSAPQVGVAACPLPNEDGHRHGDRNPSASVNIPSVDSIAMLACSMATAFDLMMTLEHKDAQPATMTALGIAPRQKRNPNG